MNNLYKLLISVIGCELVGILSTPFTVSAIPDWYASLSKSFLSPPNWVFGPVWTILYLLMGISFYLIWKGGWKKKTSKTAKNIFLTQLGFNFLWSPIFFGLHSPILGLATIIVLLTLIIMTMRKFYPISKLAFYLLIPYLLWVSFATILNTAIVVLN